MKRSKPIEMDMTHTQYMSLLSLNALVEDADKTGKPGCLIAQVYPHAESIVVRFLDNEATEAMRKVLIAVPEAKD